MAESPKPSQAGKFKELARELECDEEEEAFNAALTKVATAPHKPKLSGGKPK